MNVKQRDIVAQTGLDAHMHLAIPWIVRNPFVDGRQNKKPTFIVAPPPLIDPAVQESDRKKLNTAP
jgi:hypothetical protein